MASVSERSNQAWVSALIQTGPRREEALADLRVLLVRGLRYALANSTVRESDVEDFAQEAMLRILNGLDSFRGESRFLTWAQKIAIRVAYSELRRRRWRDVSLDGLMEATPADPIDSEWADDAISPEQLALQRMAMDTLRRVIDHELTERQRKALVATQIHGMPIEEVARRMGTNRNALYKLLHDARKRLKLRLASEGLSPEELLGLFGSATG